MGKSVKVYSTARCPFCVSVKEYLKQNNVEFQDIDVSTNEDAAEEMVKKSGQMGVPVLDIDSEVIVGFDQDKINAALSI